MNIEQEREAFERHWYNFYHMGSIKARPDGRYHHPAVQNAWEAWQARAALQSQPINWEDPFERLKNPLTPYGLLVRALRIVADTTLMEMSKAVCATPAQLSSMEFGRTQPTDEMICFVHRFFHDKGLSVPLDLFRQANQARRIEGADDA